MSICGGYFVRSKEEKEEALKIYAQGTELNPMWDYLVENRIRALVNNNQADEAIGLQKKLIEKRLLTRSYKECIMMIFRVYTGS
jgi:hypothetical protein